MSRPPPLPVPLQTANARPLILDASVVEGYPYADVAHMGMAWVAVADGDREAAREAAQWMAARAWSGQSVLHLFLMWTVSGPRC